MAWISISLEVAAEVTEILADALLEGGALAVHMADADVGTALEQPLFGEPGSDPGLLWRHNRLEALFDDQTDHAAALHAACEQCAVVPVPEVTLTEVGEQDWVLLTQQQFAPVRISARLWIVPSWCEPPDPDAFNLRLDPGLAFGTGSHPTTWQCLDWLERHLSAGSSVLDYGCGSGILAIAARQLGAARVSGVDIDPQAVLASRANAQANDVAVDFGSPDQLLIGEFDVVIANILSSPLKVLAPLLSAHTRIGGTLVLAGVLEQQALEVAQAYATWFRLLPSSQREGWTCLTGRRLA